MIFSYNFWNYILIPICMWVPSRRFRIWRLRRWGVKIGNNTTICRNVEFRNTYNIEIGNGCTINKHTLLDGRGGKIIIGDNVDIAQETNIWTLEHDPHTHEAKGASVIIDDYVWIGNRTTILPGAHINKDSICGACSLITKDVPENTIVGGVPAKVLRKRDRTKDYKLSFNSKWR